MVDYKLFYKIDGVDVWKTFNIDADNDFDAVLKVGMWIAEHNPDRYGLEKITTVRLV